MNPFANMKEWPAAGKAHVITCRWEQCVHVHVHGLVTKMKPFTLLYCCSTSWSKALNPTASWNKSQSCFLVTYLSSYTPNMGVTQLLRDVVPSKPFHFHPHPNPSGAFSVLLGLWRVVLPFAGVPEEQRNADWGQSHDTKRSPVQLYKGNKGSWDFKDIPKGTFFFVLFKVGSTISI